MMVRGFASIVLAVTVGLSSLAAADTGSAERKARKEQVCQKLRPSIETLVSTGLIMKHSKDWSEISVSKDWYRTPYDAKENIVKAVAECFSLGGLVTFKDGFSGKKLGESGPFVGYKVYE